MKPETISGALRLLEAMKKDNRKQRQQPHRDRPNQAVIKTYLMERCRGRCEACGFEMPDASLLNVHHVKPISKGGPDELENCALLCPNCHAIAHWLERTEESWHPTCPADVIEALRIQRAKSAAA